MNLGETYLVTKEGNERLGKQKLDLVVLWINYFFL
jgi:Xaa-Pro dipeptidase